MEINYYNTKGIIIEKFTNLFINNKIDQFNKENSLTANHGNILKVLHKCSKKEGYQLSIFSNNEATGDIYKANLKELIKEMYNLF